MGRLRLEHFITSTNADTIEAQLDRYRQAGFLPNDQTVRHAPGLRNGFVPIGPEYIEFTWVEDREQFGQGGGIPGIQDYHAATRPWGIGLEVADVEAARASWRDRGYTLPPTFSRGPRDAAPDAAPAWTFQPIPRAILPGVHCFALTYHGGSAGANRAVPVAPNSTYAIEGLTLVTAEPATRAAQWQAFLAPDEAVQEVAGASRLRIGPHTVTWLTPEEYHRRYGQNWQAAPHAAGELAMVHLLAVDLGIATRALTRAGWGVASRRDRDDQESLFVAPDPSDGLVFAITAEPADAWAARRCARTGEKMHLAR